MFETLVLCGGAPAPSRAKKTLVLSTQEPGQNVFLDSDGVGRRMLRCLPNALADLQDVATYVYAADQLVGRGGPTAARLGSEWRRAFHFIVAVREPDRWSSGVLVGVLERLLGFMSDDSYRFEFVPRPDWPPVTDYFDFGANADEVVLFSGGMDSLTGTMDRLSQTTDRLLLVSHQSSTKIASRQRRLIEDIRIRFPDRVIHVPVRVSMRNIEPVERTQRTRSFLFGALGAAVSGVGGAHGFSLFENGIVSLNLPIASQVVGAAATRTTHPKVIRDLELFLSVLLERDAPVRNPYIWKTKTEVANRLLQLGHSDLAKHTVSCSRVYQMTRLHTHCGCCSQCLDRRFGALAAGLGRDDPEEMYEVDLLTGSRESELDRTMAEAFVGHALELGDLNERSLMSRFGAEVATAASCIAEMPRKNAVQSLLDLHRRHGAAVRGVLADGFRQYAHELASQVLPPSCILRMVAAPNASTAQAVFPSESASANSPGNLDDLPSSKIRVALDAKGKRLLIGNSASAIAGKARFALLHELVRTASEDRQVGRAPERHRFIKATHLAKSLGIPKRRSGEVSIESDGT